MPRALQELHHRRVRGVRMVVYLTPAGVGSRLAFEVLLSAESKQIFGSEASFCSMTFFEIHKIDTFLHRSELKH